eukprot:TRINITY_DN15051_c2_g1_i1.p1 TRINITY_DN15051_c2_g1~~TRINITY_DN15051_c2_g1_i1.p1  ORF type:complete len:110 (-),score=2.19 TRINITY_DN15051_c2_g1_i1:1402-1731(-)
MFFFLYIFTMSCSNLFGLVVCAICMLSHWEKKLAIIATDGTKDYELAIIHLGDFLWKERCEVYLHMISSCLRISLLDATQVVIMFLFLIYEQEACLNMFCCYFADYTRC